MAVPPFTDSAATPASTDSQPTEQPAQGSHHYVITLQAPYGGGVVTSSFSGTVTPGPTLTRRDVFTQIQEEIAAESPHLASANVMFFSLERNQL